MKYHLLTDGIANPKTAKDDRYLSAILHLAPHKASGYNVCQFADQCIFPCLNTSGRGKYDVIQEARIRRTRLFFEDRSGFMRLLCYDLAKLEYRASLADIRPACRLNGTSDLPWECIRWEGQTIMDRFKRIQFYDYTKDPRRMRTNSTAQLQPNYHLTFSVQPSNVATALEIAACGHNVAVVFNVAYHAPSGRYDPLPRYWSGYPVHDGDKSDLRFLDPVGHVIGLRAKGKAKQDTSGFAVQPSFDHEYIGV